jgi:rhodanese-related sulfurtransferase
MKNFFSKLSLNKRLAGIALLFGVIAIFAGNPYKGSNVSVDTKELGLIVQKGADNVKAEELASWIIQGKSDYRLLDLRNEKEFEDYHIQTAESVPFAKLEGYDISRNEKIILYSTDGIQSSQGWMLLKAKGFNGVYMLSGGLEEWKQKILFPICPDSGSADEKAAFEKKKEISKFFGGVPQTTSGENIKKESPKMEMPKLESPGGNDQTAPTGKKKKEGC